MVAHRLAVQLEIEAPGVNARLGTRGNTEAMADLPAGIVDFVCSQTKPVTAFGILGRVVGSIVSIDRRGIKTWTADHPGPPVDDPAIPPEVTYIGDLYAAFLGERPAGQQTVILGNVQSAIGKAFVDLIPTQSTIIDSAHRNVAVIEVHGLPFLPVGTDAKRGLARTHRAGKGHLVHKFTIEEDALFLPVPSADKVLPTLGLDQPGLRLLKGGRIIGTS